MRSGIVQRTVLVPARSIPVPQERIRW